MALARQIKKLLRNKWFKIGLITAAIFVLAVALTTLVPLSVMQIIAWTYHVGIVFGKVPILLISIIINFALLPLYFEETRKAVENIDHKKRKKRRHHKNS
jgi:hypothetical protein